MYITVETWLATSLPSKSWTMANMAEMKNQSGCSADIALRSPKHLGAQVIRLNAKRESRGQIPVVTASAPEGASNTFEMAAD